jgi:hypothetical protein
MRVVLPFLLALLLAVPAAEARAFRSGPAKPLLPPLSRHEAPKAAPMIPSRPAAMMAEEAPRKSAPARLARAFGTGLVGAGVLGALTGGGVFEALDGVASGIGLAVQLILLVWGGRFAWRLWRRLRPARAPA